MPKYINREATPHYIDGITFEPGQVVLTDKFIQGINFNMEVDLTTNLYTSIILSQKVTGPGTITLPATNTGYTISIFCPASSEATFQLNHASQPLATVGGGDKFERTYRTRLVNSIIFTAVTTSVYVTITKE